jgi:hypothetical protein
VGAKVSGFTTARTRAAVFVCSAFDLAATVGACCSTAGASGAGRGDTAERTRAIGCPTGVSSNCAVSRRSRMTSRARSAVSLVVGGKNAMTETVWAPAT